MKQVDVFKVTQDDWYGSYHIEEYFGVKKQMVVQVTFCGNISEENEIPVFRTCVWGSDDCGMEFDSHLEGESWNRFLQVIGLNCVNRQDLIDLGFVSA